MKKHMEKMVALTVIVVALVMVGLYPAGATALRTLTLTALTSSTVTCSTCTASVKLQGPFPSVQVVGAAGTILADACGGVKRLSATAARTTSTTDTFAAAAADNAGCAMDVINVSTNAITLDYNINFNSAGAADVVLGSSDTVRVFSTGAGGAWFQAGATGNN
jgi:hypothetical protein